MSSDQTRQALWDIRDNGKLARDFVKGLTFETFQDDRRSFYAVTRAREIVSEAARRLPPESRDRHPQLPWRAIMGVGNVYRLNYDLVAEEYVWRTVHEGLPALLAVIDAEISRLGDTKDD
jgi:uncharacterized protein with HEPN domain